jgi:ketosteroid isomerase-like protein
MATITTTEAEAFVAEFAGVWDDASVVGHAELWADDIVLVQPMMGALRGKAACMEAFGRLFRLIPDLRADVHRWSADDEAVFIEFTLSGTFGGRRLSWDAVDRFFLTEDGLIAERVSYFDAVPLALAMAARPRGWWRLLRSRVIQFR